MSPELTYLEVCTCRCNIVAKYHGGALIVLRSSALSRTALIRRGAKSFLSGERGKAGAAGQAISR